MSSCVKNESDADDDFVDCSSESEEEIGDAIVKARLLDDPLALDESLRLFVGKNEVNITFQHFKAQDLSSNISTWIMDLMDRNMRELYEKSQDGWNPEDKKEEMTDLYSRYLIAFMNESPIGFTHFQFDMDYGREVLYCYEIQLELSARAGGLGKRIMEALEKIAEKANVPLVVLTVFKHNPKARKFFSHVGYQIDSTSPLKNEKRDYFILSKQIKLQNIQTDDDDLI